MTGAKPPLCTTPLVAADLAQAVALSSGLGWPYREEDWRFALALGHGIKVSVESRLAATALWWPYEPACASCGMIIVSPDFQKQGIGYLIMEELLRQAQGRTIVLCSTLAGERLYERLGFVPQGFIYQHQALLPGSPAVPLPTGLRALLPAELPELVELDRRASGMGRGQLLEALHAVGQIVVVSRHGELTGYACIRRWGRGVVIGPVVAADATQAKALIAVHLASQAGRFVRIDVTDASGLSSWLGEIGLGRVDHGRTMAKGKLPRVAEAPRVLALANQSLG
jgi:GNAT superfamily N-acetyltransferase